jgi:hypothetical protein
VLTNSYSREETVTTTETITFPWKPKQLQITNDSPTADLQYKLRPSETFRTLKPYETSTLTEVSVTKLYLAGTSTPYRVWGLG